MEELMIYLSTVIGLSLLLMIPLYFNIRSLKKTKKEVEDRNVALHIIYSIPYRQKDGKEMLIFMKADGNKKNGTTIGIRCRSDCFCVQEEYDERDMKFYAQLIKEGYYRVDDNYKNCKDWYQYSINGNIYDGTWKECIKSRKRNSSK